MVKFWLEQTVNSFDHVEVAQAGTLRGLRSPQGYRLELSETMLVFVQVFYWGRGTKVIYTESLKRLGACRPMLRPSGEDLKGSHQSPVKKRAVKTQASLQDSFVL